MPDIPLSRVPPSMGFDWDCQLYGGDISVLAGIRFSFSIGEVIKDPDFAGAFWTAFHQEFSPEVTEQLEALMAGRHCDHELTLKLAALLAPVRRIVEQQFTEQLAAMLGDLAAPAARVIGEVSRELSAVPA